MHWQSTLYILPLLIAAAISSALALYVGKKHLATPGAPMLVVLMLAVAEWSLGYALRLASVDLQAKLFWAKVRYFGIVVVPAAWLVFALQYTGRGRWLTYKNMAALAIVPLAVLALVWTNGAHHLFWTDIRVVDLGEGLFVWSATHGLTFWIHTVYSYVILLLGSILLFQTIIRAPSPYRGQVVALLIGALAPWVGNALSVFGLVRLPLDLTPFGFTVAGLAVAWSLFRFRLLDIVPAAYGAIFESMSDGVFVLDVQDRIVNLNPVAQQVLGCIASNTTGASLESIVSSRADLVELYQTIVEAPTESSVLTEITLEAPTEGLESVVDEAGSPNGTPGEEEAKWYYELRVSPLRTRRGRLVGRLVVLHDITERKRAEEALRAQKQLFEGLVAVARATNERPTLEATLQSTLTIATELTGAEYGTLFLLDEDGSVTHNLLVRGHELLEQSRDVVARVMSRGMAGWVARHRQPVLVPDVLHDGRWLHLPDVSSSLSRSAMVVPIVNGAALLGILTLTHPKPGHFSTEHVQLMQAAANQMRLALRNAQIFDVQRRMADRQTTLYEVLRAVAGQLTPDAVMQAAVRAIVEFAGWPNVIIALPTEDNTFSSVEAVGGTLWPKSKRTDPIDQGVIGRAFKTVETQLVPDVDADPDYVAMHRAICSVLAVPLRRGERVLGVLGIESEQTAAFDADDVLLAELLAEAIALTIDNSRLYAETRQHLSDLDTLYTVTRMTGQSLALEDVLTRALASVLLSFGFDAGYISLVDPADNRLHVVAEHGVSSALSRRLQEDGLEGTLCSYVRDCRKSFVISDSRAKTSEELRSMISEVASFGLRSCVGVPLLHREESLGVMCLFTHRRRSFPTSEMALLEAIGRQVATAVTHARLFQATVNERQRLFTLIESSRDGIILVGMDKRMLVVNAPALELLSLSGEPKEWTDRPLQDALDVVEDYAPFTAQALRAEMIRIRAGDEPPTEGEFDVFPRAIHWLSLPVLADETPLGRLLVLRDVTEERLLAKMRDDLVHTMVHDLRNPLTGISVALQLLDSKLTDVITPAQHRLFEIAINSTQKMVDLVNAILDLSRLERGQMPLSSAPVSLSDLVAETLDLQLPLSTEKDLHLESDVPSTLPPAWADPELIGRVLQNLVGNAIKFTPAGGSVKVRARESDQELGRQTEPGRIASPYLRVSVADTGLGISPELQGKLFQKFVVGEQEGRGSGLGLAFCKLAVEAHGGRIWVESEPGKGSTFVFTLSIAREDGVARME